jgi:hypothetical protein
MHSAWCQHRDRVDILPRKKIIDVIMRGNAELRGNGVGTCPYGIANGDETGPVDMTTPQQLGVALRNTSWLAEIISQTVPANGSHGRLPVQPVFYIDGSRCKSRFLAGCRANHPDRRTEPEE